MVRVLNINGIFKKFEIERVGPGTIKSSYNLIKKDDINVELILGQLLLKERNPMDKYTNIYNNMLVREFQAHDDAITNMSVINEPFSFLTCSKDKKFKIWNFQCDILGEVNTIPTMTSPKIETPWNFEVDWDKLNKEEIREVIKTFEEVAHEKDLVYIFDENNLEADSSTPMEEPKRVIVKKDVPIRKKRYKPLELTAKEDDDDPIKNRNRHKDPDELNLDDQLLQENRDRIKKIINLPNIDYGIFEMTKNIIDLGTKRDIRDLNINYPALNIKGPLTQRTKKIGGIKSIPKQKHNIERDGFFAEKLISSSKAEAEKSNPFGKLTDKKSHNIKFKKGETERILANEYYQNSYKSSIKTSGLAYSIEDNSHIKQNYNRLWKSVNEFKDKLFTKESTADPYNYKI
jgi:hypothetical protein